MYQPPFVKVLVLLSCGHWIEGGNDPLFWIAERAARRDQQCQRDQEPTTALVEKVLVASTRPPFAAIEAWIEEKGWA